MEDSNRFDREIKRSYETNRNIVRKRPKIFEDQTERAGRAAGHSEPLSLHNRANNDSYSASVSLSAKPKNEELNSNLDNSDKDVSAYGRYQILIDFLFGSNRENERLESSSFKETESISRDFFRGIEDFLRNKSSMEEKFRFKGQDKYFHCMANCESASRGIGGKMAAALISNARETIDFPKNIFAKGLTIDETLNDFKEDMEANKRGYDAGSKGLRCRGTCNYYIPRGSNIQW